MQTVRRPGVPGGAAILLLLASLAACGGKNAPPPAPGTVRGSVPDLRGRRVMVLPVQELVGVPGDADAELLFGLRERSAEVAWIPPAEIEAALARSPGLAARTRGLPVGQFLTAEVLRVGDPLFGQLLRMASVTDAEAVLLPVQASTVAGALGEDPRVRFVTALIDVRTGRVAWFSILEGGPFPPGDPRGLATAVEEVSQALLWYAAR